MDVCLQKMIQDNGYIWVGWEPNMYDRSRRVAIDGRFFFSTHISEPVIQANGRCSAEFCSKAPQGVGDHEAHSIGRKPLGPLLVCRVYRYSCFPLYIRTEASFLQKTCMIDMQFRRIEDSTGITHLRSQDTTACCLEACLLAGSLRVMSA